ncbi:MAG TPA: hypothetical protein VLF62_02885 [Candidatus Saccharimonadales bacterium]|nr:hypothetical protein [Candidatus Saccharimonadales bacterium]
MALKVYPTEKRNAEPDLAIFLPYTWGGDYHNNRQLQEDLSLITGALVIGAQTPGTGTLFVGRKTRKKLQPYRFADMAAEYAAEVNEYLAAEGRPRRLLVAQSGRVALGAHMQLSESRPFSHVLLRDGVNLMGQLTVMQGYHHLKAQPGRGERQGVYQGEHKNTAHKLQDKLAMLHGYVEIITQGQTLCSDESLAAVTKLARDVTTPLHHVTFANGITGPRDKQQEFNTALGDIRHTSLPPGDGMPAQLLAHMETGNHADLLHVGLLSTHIDRTLELQPYRPSPKP